MQPEANVHHPCAASHSAARRGLFLWVLVALTACGHAARPIENPPPRRDEARTPSIETPKKLEAATGYHANLGHGAELYLPPWFEPKKGGYDLLVHFHGEGRLQVANVEHAKLNVAVVSVNHSGFGTEPYANAFKRPEAFTELLRDTDSAIEKSQRGGGAKLRRLALSAWSAGFSSVAKIMNGEEAARVDAVLLADGFFSNFTDLKKRTVNAQGLEKFTRFAQAARHGDKLFVVTHTTIPTGPYPSVQECITKLLEILELPKGPPSGETPPNMQPLYAVDEGSLHVRGFEGTRAIDHVRQLHAMGETAYPYLKARWAD